MSRQRIKDELMLFSMIVLTAGVVTFITGCTALEQTWSTGKKVGSKVLSEDTKEKLKPYVDSAEKLYEIKDAGK